MGQEAVIAGWVCKCGKPFSGEADNVRSTETEDRAL